MTANNLDILIALQKTKEKTAIFWPVFFPIQKSPWVGLRICVQILDFLTSDLWQTSLKRTQTGETLQKVE